MWRAMEWACNQTWNVVIDTLKKMKKWRSTAWWQSQHTRMMKEDPENLQDGSISWVGTIEGMCGT